MLFVPDGLSLHVWTIAAAERGTRIGVRESAVSTELLNDCKLSLADYDVSWAQDPYEPAYAAVDRTALRCLADDERYDQRFPDHPLSKVRRMLRLLPEAVTRS